MTFKVRKMNCSASAFKTGTWNKFRFPKQLHWMERNLDIHEIN